MVVGVRGSFDRVPGFLAVNAQILPPLNILSLAILNLEVRFVRFVILRREWIRTTRKITTGRDR